MGRIVAFKCALCGREKLFKEEQAPKKVMHRCLVRNRMSTEMVKKEK